MISYLTIPNQYGKTAKVLLTENFPNLEIVQVPELSTTSGEMLYMTVRDLYGDETGWTAFAEKFRMGRLIPELSSYKQKASAATWGCVIRRPSTISLLCLCWPKKRLSGGTICVDVIHLYRRRQ